MSSVFNIPPATLYVTYFSSVKLGLTPCSLRCSQQWRKRKAMAVFLRHSGYGTSANGVRETHSEDSNSTNPVFKMNLNFKAFIYALVLAILPLGLVAQSDALFYTDKNIYFPREQLCLRVIWPQETQYCYLQAATANGLVKIKYTLDFKNSRTYANCLPLPGDLTAGNYSITVVDNTGLALTTSILLYGSEGMEFGESESVRWQDTPNLIPSELPDDFTTLLLSGPVKKEQISLNLPGDLSTYHICLTDAKFSAPGGTWMNQDQIAITGQPGVGIRGKVILNESLDESKQPLLMANLIGKVGDFSGATIQRDGTFELNDLTIEGPTSMKLFLPEEYGNSKIEYHQPYPVISGQKSTTIALPENLREVLDLYWKMNTYYSTSTGQSFIPENDLFTHINRTYLLNEFLPLPTVEDVISDILVGVKVVKENGEPVDIRINDDALLTMTDPVSPLIFVNNNLLWDNSEVFNLPVESIYKIAVIPSVDSRDIFGYVGIGGAMSINLDQEVDWIQPHTEGLIQGPLVESFLRDTDPVGTQPDFRSTLIWSPELDDKSARLDFATTDFDGEYLLKISGVNEQGEVEYYQEKLQLRYEQ